MKTNRIQRRLLNKENEKRPKQLALLPVELWPDNYRHDKKRTRVWLSRDYLVQEFKEDNAFLIRLSVNRTTMNADGRWEDNLTWDELQKIKHDVGYGDHYAIEVYPKDIDVVNVANMRHIWVLPAPLYVGWFK